LINEHKTVSDEQQEAYDEFAEAKGTFLPFSKEHIHNVTEDIYNREIKMKADYPTIFY